MIDLTKYNIKDKNQYGGAGAGYSIPEKEWGPQPIAPQPTPGPVGTGPWSPTPIPGPVSPLPAPMPMPGPTGQTVGLTGLPGGVIDRRGLGAPSAPLPTPTDRTLGIAGTPWDYSGRGGRDRGDYDRGGGYRGGGGYGGGTLPGDIYKKNGDTTDDTTNGDADTDTGDTEDIWRPGDGTYSKAGDFQEDYGFTPTQEWLRDHRWGGHIMWNPTYGFQDYRTVAKLYDGKEMSDEDFANLDLTAQHGPEWEQYFPERVGDYATRGGGTGAGTETTTASGTDPYGGNIYGNFPYPPEWGIAGNVLSNFAMGLPTQIPQSWEDMLRYSQEWAEGGKPGDTSAWFEAQMPLLQRQIEDQSKELAEQYGMAGLGWSSPLQRSQTEMTGRASENLWAQAMTQQMGLDESAKARAMAALPMMFQGGAGIAGLSEAAKNRGMQAAGGLMGLGQQRANLPMQVAGGLERSGYGQTALSQADIDRQTAEWMRLLPENSPWLQYALGAGGQAGQSPYAYPQYNPSSQTQMMQMWSSMMPWLWQMFGGGNQTPTDPYGSPTYYDQYGNPQ